MKGHVVYIFIAVEFRSVSVQGDQQNSMEDDQKVSSYVF